MHRVFKKRLKYENLNKAVSAKTNFEIISLNVIYIFE